jgi:hypothetical protein
MNARGSLFVSKNSLDCEASTTFAENFEKNNVK